MKPATACPQMRKPFLGPRLPPTPYTHLGFRALGWQGSDENEEGLRTPTNLYVLVCTSTCGAMRQQIRKRFDMSGTLTQAASASTVMLSSPRKQGYYLFFFTREDDSRQAAPTRAIAVGFPIGIGADARLKALHGTVMPQAKSAEGIKGCQLTHQGTGRHRSMVTLPPFHYTWPYKHRACRTRLASEGLGYRRAHADGGRPVCTLPPHGVFS